MALGLTGFTIVGWDGLGAHVGGVRGIATVTDCDYHAGQAGHWDRTGTFASTDGSVRLGGVEVVGGEHRVGDQVAATVNGRAGANAWPVDDWFWWWGPIQILLMLGGAGVVSVLFHRSLRQDRRRAALAAVAVPRIRRTKVKQRRPRHP